jgi:hypothetical protein
LVNCGKSTVETDLKAAVRLLGEHALAGEIDFTSLHERILEHLSAT